MAFAPVHLSVCVRGGTSWNGRCLNLKLFIFFHLYQWPCDSSLVALILQKEVQKSCKGYIIPIKTRLREMLSFIYQVSIVGNLIFYPLNQSSGEARLVRYQVTLPDRNFPSCWSNLCWKPLSQTDLTSSPIWTLHFHKCHNNEAGDEVFKVSSLIIGLFIRTVLVAHRKWVETIFVYSFFLMITSLMLHISANMFCTFIYIYHIYL